MAPVNEQINMEKPQAPQAPSTKMHLTQRNREGKSLCLIKVEQTGKEKQKQDNSARTSSLWLDSTGTQAAEGTLLGQHHSKALSGYRLKAAPPKVA